MLVRMYVYPRMKLTPEEIAEIEALDKLADEDIDLSDIPELTEEDFKRMWRANPRTPEEWEQYYRNCPPHRQKRYAELRQKFGPII